MRYPKAFFDLQIRFAEAASRLGDIPLERALLDYTNLYIRFGLGRAFDPYDSIWRDYTDGLRQATDISDWTYRFYLTRCEQAASPPTTPSFGCFSYVMQDAQCVRIHFQNWDPVTVSPLSTERYPIRLAELRSLFCDVFANNPDARRVVGTSWLYNLRAYRRCFPEEYVAGAKAECRFRNMSLWGQFLDRHGSIKASSAEDFMQRLTAVADLRTLASIFPLQALAAEAPIAAFYRFYGIAPPKPVTTLQSI
ncbi:hypothetical protein [Trinickia sp.]|uniref:hypothetical protein n=1 Tax=Trinickia sp. TaxID=2571163 RepID=UPI003F7E088F